MKARGHEDRVSARGQSANSNGGNAMAAGAAAVRPESGGAACQRALAIPGTVAESLRRAARGARLTPNASLPNALLPPCLLAHALSSWPRASCPCQHAKWQGSLPRASWPDQFCLTPHAAVRKQSEGSQKAIRGQSAGSQEAGSHEAATLGNVSVNLLPSPNVLVATRSPFIPRARSRLIARPRPTPCWLLGVR